MSWHHCPTITKTASSTSYHHCHTTNHHVSNTLCCFWHNNSDDMYQSSPMRALSKHTCKLNAPNITLFFHPLPPTPLFSPHQNLCTTCRSTAAPHSKDVAVQPHSWSRSEVRSWLWDARYESAIAATLLQIPSLQSWVLSKHQNWF